MYRKTVMLPSLFCLLLFSAPWAMAADTTEAFDAGASGFELYMGFDGIGLGKYEKAIWCEALAAFGVVDGFGLYLAAAGESNEYFNEGGGGISLGMLGTPVDTDYFDMDLMLDFSFSSDEFGITPALEMNFDFDPDMATGGFYLRLEQEFAGRDETEEAAAPEISCESVDELQAGGTSLLCTEVETGEPDTSYVFAPSTGLTLGAYYMVAENHQILVEYDMAFANNPADDENITEIGGIALGYNVVLADEVEMANQLYFDIPQSGEEFSVGIATGFIFAIPVGGGETPEPELIAMAEQAEPAREDLERDVDLLAEGLVTLDLVSSDDSRFHSTHVRQLGGNLEIYGKVARGASCEYKCHVSVFITKPDGGAIIEINLPYVDRGVRVKGWTGAHYRAHLPITLPDGSKIRLEFKDVPRFMEEKSVAASEKEREEIQLPADLLEKAKLMLRIDDYRYFEKAETDFLTLRFKNPDDAEVNGWLAQTYAAWGEQINHEMAMMLKQAMVSEAARKIKKIKALSAIMNHRRAQLFYVNESAKALAQSLIDAKPDNYIGYRVMADYYRIEGDRAKMNEYLTQVERLNPDSVGLLFVRGAEQAKFDKNYEGAVLIYDQVLDKDPMFVKALFFKALALKELGKAEEAKAAMDEVLKKSPKHPGVLAYRSMEQYLEELNEEAEDMVP